MSENQKALYYYQVTDLWKRFCEEHSTLYNMTCEEYEILLSSNVDSLEDKIQQKEDIILNISALEQVRQQVIEKINAENILDYKIERVRDLLDAFENYEKETNQAHLRNFNDLLIELIENIQAQNKKNQIFINKALNSLREIRESAQGKKSYSTYNSTGKQQNNGV